MNVRITPSRLCGEMTPPPSKSVSHRAVICAGLALSLGNGESRITNLLDCDDIIATSSAFSTIKEETADIYCNESGSTLRFLIPVFAALGLTRTFYGEGELPNRPITPYLKELPKHGLNFETTAMPYKIKGRLTPGEYRIDGGVSSQFITGLLLALPLLDGDSEITLTSPLKSKPYADITVDVMARFGVDVAQTERGYFVKGNRAYKPCDFTVEADMSQAAFFIAANALGADINIKGLNPNSAQGDRVILDIAKSPPAKIDVSDIPDLVPVLTVLCGLREGVTRIYNCSRLRLKECDRLAAISTELNKIGGRVKILPDDSLEITGVGRFEGGKTCSSWNDHRIAMALTVAAMKCEQPIIIENADCVKKSYLDFFGDIRKLGGVIDVLDV